MSDIDWSQAPEGATHYCGTARHPWLRDSDHPDFFNENRGEWQAYGVAEYGKRHIVESVPRPVATGPLRAEEFDHLVQPEAHVEDQAVDAFAWAMVRRLAQCRAAGRSGWDDPEQCPPQRLAEGLVRAVRAGKLVDVGNYAMMLWKRADRAQAMARVPGWIGEALSHPAHHFPSAPEEKDSLEMGIELPSGSTRVEWDGTGLPPVGTYVEVHRKGRNPGPGRVVGEHMGKPVVWLGNKDYARMSVDWLRPLLTPEQRAAKERDKAVAAMCKEVEARPDVQRANTTLGASAALRVAYMALYDLGYRKTD